MKQLNPIFALAALLLATNACEQSPVQDQDNPQAPYYLSVDKSVIEADGKETATITLKDATGLVLTDEAHIKNVSLYVKETDTYFTRRTNTFTSIDNGNFTIEGMYLGTPCEAPVVVTAQNRAKYEVFKKKVAIYRNTATWCVNCPSMTSALDNVDNYTKERSALLCFHGDQYYGLKSNGNFLSEYILSTFGNWDDFNFNYGLYFCLCDILERPRPDFGTKAAAPRDVEILSCTGPQLKPGRFGNVVYP